jgi:hypothetical protein
MDNFDANGFRDLANSPLGVKLWQYLHEQDNLIRMETAAYLGRPAIEPLSPSLLARFGDEVREDRVKQMIGRMARQINERRGYQLEERDVPITSPSNMFTQGTRYTARAKAA